MSGGRPVEVQGTNGLVYGMEIDLELVSARTASEGYRPVRERARRAHWLELEANHLECALAGFTLLSCHVALRCAGQQTD